MNGRRPELVKLIGNVLDPRATVAPDLVVGRRSEVNEVLLSLTKNTFPVIYGTSGVGKSVLVDIVERIFLSDATGLAAFNVPWYAATAPRYEVFRIDGAGPSPVRELRTRIGQWLRTEGVAAVPDPGTVFDLVARVHEMGGQPIMVLVDDLGPADRNEELGHLLNETRWSTDGELRFVLVTDVNPIGKLFSPEIRGSLTKQLSYVPVHVMPEADLVALLAKRVERLGGDLTVDHELVSSVAAVANGCPKVAIQVLGAAALAAEKHGHSAVSRRDLDLGIGAVIAELRASA